MPSGFDTNDPAVLAPLDNILARAEAGDESVWTRLADCGLGVSVSAGSRDTTPIALANWLGCIAAHEGKRGYL